MRTAAAWFVGLALPMAALLLWAIRDTGLEPSQRAALILATLATAAIAAWLVTLLD